MKEGKLSNETLAQSIIDQLKHQRDDILIGAGVGEDCAAIAFGNLACVLTTDPITGATENLGELAVQIACNDIASSGVKPVALLMTLLLPLSADEDEPSRIMAEAQMAASGLGVAIIGGHTEFTSAVTRTVVSVTAVGKGLIETLTPTQAAQAGDLIVISKTAALEGTAIICHEFSDKLLAAGMSEALIASGKALMSGLSVLNEGQIASSCGVHAMHDVTEGGVFGAVWEMAEASNLGAIIHEASIPLAESTRRMCELMALDPYRLISSGVMLMAFSQDAFEVFEAKARAAQIEVSVIGEFTASKERWIRRGQQLFELEAPGTDELYRVFQ